MHRSVIVPAAVAALFAIGGPAPAQSVPPAPAAGEAAHPEARTRTERLAAMLPAPRDGWSRIDDPAALSTASAFGIVSAKVTYWATDPSDPRDEFTRMMERVPSVSISCWDRPPPEMLAQVEAQRRMAEQAGLGHVETVGGESVLVSPLGDIQLLVGGHLMVAVSGMASAEDKRAYFDALDLAAMREF